MTELLFPEEIEVGAATHTGCVRPGNEDDYLVLAADGAARLAADGVLLAVADGMGGVSGGAEASRAAIRWLGSTWADGSGRSTSARLQEGFDSACERVHELAHANPGLRDMGTTLTALALLGDRAVIAHVGDTRCLRIRHGAVEQLTVDHAMAGARNLLTRCIGAGQLREEVDLTELDVAAGDVFVLCTDGVWSQVDADELGPLCRSSTAQEVAERLVELSVQRGAPDNCTVVAARVVHARPASGRTRPAVLPSGELRLEFARSPVEKASLVPPRWPWLAVVLGVALAVLAVLRVTRGIDPLDWLVRGGR
ncbi:MAG: serine/threonine-protein phosphatase [Planctomycetes bacterium]|nr:serine/threonine-protein phosphatase [Planctomycetota bacterium]